MNILLKQCEILGKVGEFGRKNTVDIPSSKIATTPINVSPAVNNNMGISKEKLLKEIEKKAYEIHIKNGGKNGNSLNDWLEAEIIIKNR